MKSLLRITFLLFLSTIFSACGKNFSELLQKSETQFAAQDYVGAVDTLNIAIPIWKSNDTNFKKGRAYEILGLSYHKLRNTDKAIEAFEQAIETSTSTYSAAYSLGSIQLMRSQPQAALKAFEKALQMKKDDPLALLGLGNSHFALHHMEEARIMFNLVLDTSPGVRDAIECLEQMKVPSRRSSPRASSRASNLKVSNAPKPKRPAVSPKKKKR